MLRSFDLFSCFAMNAFVLAYSKEKVRRDPTSRHSTDTIDARENCLTVQAYPSGLESHDASSFTV